MSKKTSQFTQATTVADSDYIPVLSGSSNLRVRYDDFIGNKLTQKTVITVSRSAGADYVCDGTADDVQIQAALTAINTAGGGIVDVKRGTYQITANLLVYSNTILKGDGDGTLFEPNGNFHCIYINDVSNVIIRDLKIDGSDVTTYTTANGIRIEDATNVRILDAKVVNSKSFAIGVTATGVSTTTKQIWIERCTLTGEGLSDVIGGGGEVLTTSLIREIIVENCNIEQNVNSTGTYYNAIDMVGVAHVQFNNNTVKGGVIFGVEQFPNEFSKISGNTINQANGSTINTQLIVGAGAGGTDNIEAVNITNNILQNASISVYGISGQVATRVLIANNNIYCAGGLSKAIYTSYVSNSVIAHNIMTNGTNGVYTDNTSYCLIQGNVITNFTNGTNIGTAGTYLNYVDNVFVSCTNTHANVDYTTCSIRETQGAKTCYGIYWQDAAAHFFYWGQNDVPAVKIKNVGTNNAHYIENATTANNTRTWAQKIVSDNAGTGTALPGGIDLSTMSVDEPLLKAPTDAITTAGAVTGQIAIDIGGTTYYLPYYTHGS